MATLFYQYENDKNVIPMSKGKEMSIFCLYRLLRITCTFIVFTNWEQRVFTVLTGSAFYSIMYVINIWKFIDNLFIENFVSRILGSHISVLPGHFLHSLQDSSSSAGPLHGLPPYSAAIMFVREIVRRPPFPHVLLHLPIFQRPHLQCTEIY